MFRKFRMKFAREEDAVRVAQLFCEINSKASQSDIEELIQKRKVVVFRKKRKIAGAFSYALFGAGFFCFLFVTKFVVDKKLRQKGAGSFFLKKIKKFSLRQGVIGFFLWSVSHAVGFYRKNRLSNLGRIFWWWR